MKIRNLAVVSYANGFTLWHYRASEAPFTGSLNYFGDASEMLTAGDLIMVTSAEGARIMVVTLSDNGTVTTGSLS
jgi:hypothetical protein